MEINLLTLRQAQGDNRVTLSSRLETIQGFNKILLGVSKGYNFISAITALILSSSALLT